MEEEMTRPFSAMTSPFISGISSSRSELSLQGSRRVCCSYQLRALNGLPVAHYEEIGTTDPTVIVKWKAALALTATSS
ncbi:hypothetical protein Tco_0960325 [Tanacetum coccineum]